MSYDPKTYWEDRAANWIGENLSFEPWKEILDKYIDWNAKTIEIGCGTGRWSELFSDYYGIDISEKLIEHAKKTYPDKLFSVDDIRNSRFAFTQVFSFTAMEHVPTADINTVSFDKKSKLFFVEPNVKSGVEHCFNHDYEKYGCYEAERNGDLSLWTNVRL